LEYVDVFCRLEFLDELSELRANVTCGVPQRLVDHAKPSVFENQTKGVAQGTDRFRKIKTDVHIFAFRKKGGFFDHGLPQSLLDAFLREADVERLAVAAGFNERLSGKGREGTTSRCIAAGGIRNRFPALGHGVERRNEI